jgi:uncharacterized protein
MHVRQPYVDHVLRQIGTPFIKVLVGMRRVGKSALLVQVRQALDERGVPASHICWIDKEDLSFDAIRTYADLKAHVDAAFAHTPNTQSTHRKYLFIDEVQEIAQWELAVRHYAKQADVEVFITGSNAHMLSSELATHLAGRYVAFHIHGLSYREYRQFRPNGSSCSLEDFMRYGGLPGVALLTDDAARLQALEGILHTVMFRDILQRYSIRHGALLSDIAKFIAINIGYPTATKRIAEYLKKERLTLAFETVRDYLQYFQHANLLHSVGWVDAVGKRSLELNAKFYFEDLGLRNRLAGWRDEYRGQLLENLVHHELRVRGYELQVGRVKEAEIDFIATRAGEKLYIQVCYLLASPDTIQREFAPLLAVPDNYAKLVLSMDRDWGSDFEGIKRLHIEDWLLSDA